MRKVIIAISFVLSAVFVAYAEGPPERDFVDSYHQRKHAYGPMWDYVYPSEPQERQAVGECWEYRFYSKDYIDTEKDPVEFNAFLNTLGSQKWEYVPGVRLIFKRRTPCKEAP